jgi:hypothetical protein
MPSIGQTWVLASIGTVVEMGILSTLKRLLMESTMDWTFGWCHSLKWQYASNIFFYNDRYCKDITVDLLVNSLTAEYVNLRFVKPSIDSQRCRSTFAYSLPSCRTPAQWVGTIGTSLFTTVHTTGYNWKFDRSPLQAKKLSHFSKFSLMFTPLHWYQNIWNWRFSPAAK